MKGAIKILLALLVTLSFTGCSLTDQLKQKATDKIGEAVTEKVLETATNSNVDIDKNKISAESGSTSFQIGETLDKPADFPKDIPMYSGATITTTSSDSATGDYYLSYTSTEDYSKIDEYYKKELVNLGWKIDDQYTTDSTDFKSTSFLCSKEKRSLVVGMYLDKTQNQLTITITASKLE